MESATRFDLNGRTAFVTGGSRGIGRCTAETLTRSGAKVAAGDLQAPEIDGVLGVRLDVTSEESVEAAFAETERNYGPVDLLVVNAGIFRIEPFEETSLASFRMTMEVNLIGAFICLRRALPAMRERRFGRIVSLGSSAGKTGGAKSVAAYAASKGALMTLTKAVASEYASYGITANALAPALIDTEMVESMPDMALKVPVGRLGKPEEVADLVAYLCSDSAGYITGEVVDINGGFLID